MWNPFVTKEHSPLFDDSMIVTKSLSVNNIVYFAWSHHYRWNDYIIVAWAVIPEMVRVKSEKTFLFDFIPDSNIKNPRI